MPYVYLSLAILCEVLGTSLLKKTLGFTNLLMTAIVLTTYATAFYFLSLSIKSIPVSVAYAIWCGVGITLIALIDYYILKQNLNWWQLSGIALIALGVVVINFNTAPSM